MDTESDHYSEDEIVDKFQKWLESMSAEERQEKSELITFWMNQLDIGMIRLRDKTVYTLKGW